MLKAGSAWMRGVLRLVSVYCIIVYASMYLFSTPLREKSYDSFVEHSLRIPRFIMLGELMSLYRIVEWLAYLSTLTFWYPCCFLAGGLYAVTTRFYTIPKVLAIFLNRNHRLLKLSREQWKARLISGTPLLLDLCITGLLVLVVGHYLVTSLASSSASSEGASTKELLPTSESSTENSSPSVNAKNSDQPTKVQNSKQGKARSSASKASKPFNTVQTSK